MIALLLGLILRFLVGLVLGAVFQLVLDDLAAMQHDPACEQHAQPAATRKY